MRVARVERGRTPVGEQVASVVEQLAVLVAAGVAPVQAWGYLAEAIDDEFVSGVAEEASRGVPVAEAVVRAIAGSSTVGGPAAGSGRGLRSGGAADAWRALAAALFVATESGAPMRLCLTDIAESLRQLGGVERDIAAALAGPAATARLVMVLPAIAVLGGSLIGLDSLGTLLGTPAGVTCLLLGLLLSGAGRWWSSRLLRRARRIDPTPGLELELVAVAVGGGGSLPAARSLVRDAFDRYGPTRRPHRPDGPNDPAEQTVRAVLLLASRSGAPPALLLRSEAARIRRDAVSAAQERAAALGVWLMLPLGLCILPAFILLAVAPVLLGVLAGAPM
ncbi:type II secretion system F family protein [Herbiconiux sp. CPCC 203407]|uniref:Type II secretion system F family protein n=1 Tax=Herbiconiux oxytropis TaxID=2970915 RepID=A0AA42BTS5_9MICO|nr:type II secretion system F family protein [Herbiconiux oxytropis]MCS5723725.1 type II secretion system F family protein [Herbiconiux oxytropis]MCS5725496.1 type II secretion system F family protein [Herbiconiux oxytropis]